MPVVWYGSETWSLTLWGQRWLGVFENMVLIWTYVTGEWRNYVMRNLMICRPHQILCGRSNREE